MYISCTSFNGAKEGYVFKMDHLGLGYYLEDGYLSQEVESSGLGLKDSEFEKKNSILAGKHAEGDTDPKVSQGGLGNVALDSTLMREVSRNDSQIGEQETALNSDAVGSAQANSGNDDTSKAAETIAAKNVNSIEESTGREKNEKMRSRRCFS